MPLLRMLLRLSATMGNGAYEEGELAVGAINRCCCSTKKVAVLDLGLTKICCALLT